MTSEEATRLVCAVPGRHCSEQLDYLCQKVLSANLAVNIFTAKERLYQKVLSAKKSLQKVSHTVSVTFLTTPYFKQYLSFTTGGVEVSYPGEPGEIW